MTVNQSNWIFPQRKEMTIIGALNYYNPHPHMIREQTVYTENGYVHSPSLEEKELMKFRQSVCVLFFINWLTASYCIAVWLQLILPCHNLSVAGRPQLLIVKAKGLLSVLVKQYLQAVMIALLESLPSGALYLFIFHLCIEFSCL